MKDSTRQSKQKSSEKEKHDGKNFRIPISNGIFEHYARLKDARWLLDLFIDWTTQEVPAPDGSRDGLVLGGKPIRDEDTARAFGCTKRTTRRWRLRLAQFAYISQERTPLGYVIRVKKSKKWTSQNKQTEWTKMSTHSESELPNVSTQSARNGNSELPNVSTHSVSILMDNTKTVAVDREGAASPSTGNRKTEKAASLADSLLVGKTPEAWRKIGCSPLGGQQFQDLWESVFARKPDDEPLSNAMERCIQAGKETGISVPRAFYTAKRGVEGREASGPSLGQLRSDGTRDGELPRLVAPF